MATPPAVDAVRSRQEAFYEAAEAERRRFPFRDDSYERVLVRGLLQTWRLRIAFHVLH